MAKLSSSSQSTIQSTLDAVTNRSANKGISGLVFNAIDRNGNWLTQTCSGTHALTGKGAKIPMSNDSVFHIASCTKMVTGLACMQLVEKGKMKLDDHDWLYSVCPELKEKKVLNEAGDGLVDRKGEITLRMLLTHTAGFGYTFFNPRLRAWSLPTGYDEFSGDIEDTLSPPLVNQPGSRYEYGINIDWAGIALERVTSSTLNDYCQAHIFSPLGLKDISFVPTQRMRENMVTLQQHTADGAFDDTDHLCRRSIWHSAQCDEAKTAGVRSPPIFHSGGAGLFATPADYSVLLSTLLNDGVSPQTGARIIEKKTIDEMWTNQIPQFPHFGRQGVPTTRPWLTPAIPDFHPQKGDPPQGWGLTFMLTIEPCETGRGANSAFWTGIINTFWWCDREKGVAGFVAGQVLPYVNMDILGAWAKCEKAVYDGLEGAADEKKN